MCDESDKLFVLHCHTDDSHVVVDDSSVIYGESVKVGDEVQFSFPGSKGLLVGTVKGIKGDIKDAIQLQRKLNRDTRPKRERSFHEGQPRQAKLKCQEGLKSLKCNRKKEQGKEETAASATDLLTNVSEKPKSCLKDSGKEGPLAKLLNEEDDNSYLSDENSNTLKDTVEVGVVDIDNLLPEDKGDDLFKSDSGDVNSDSSSEDNNLTEEEREQLARLLKKAKAKDHAQLKSLAQATKIKETVTNEGVKIAKVTCKASHSRKRKLKVATAIRFDGQFYLHGPLTKDAVKLSDDSEVYILTSDLKNIKKQANTRTALARKLLVKIYTEAALNACSVSGKPFHGEIRPALDQKGINAIIDFVTARGNKKHYKDASDSVLKQAMGNALSEERYKSKLLMEAANVVTPEGDIGAC